MRAPSTVRFIPAYAGNTAISWRVLISRPVHPRIRGEHHSGNQPRSRSSGSSPHTRGTHPVLGAPGAGNRFIPAYAGNTRKPGAASGHAPVHPRIRGEHFIGCMPLLTSNGSSPHTRGTLDEEGAALDARRFIPAYAGNTWWLPPSLRDCAVHPRIRGEHCPVRRPSYPMRGSSPHTRGTLFRFTMAIAHVRFIPAYAGNTQTGRVDTSSRTGSSPHTRGTRARRPRAGLAARFIPAYAGNTAETTVARIWRYGSSPHTRGTPQALAIFTK